jgi:RNA polymerase sigma-70 factor (ECF subfamily)
MDFEFEKLYNAYYMKVYSYVMTLAKNQDDSEEITQKAFFKAMTAGKRQKYRGEASEFSWLCAIAKNIFLDERRAYKRKAELDDKSIDIEKADIEKTFIDEDSAFRIHRILHNLDEPYKEVFGLRIFGELSFKKIGLIFGKTEGWARVTYHRARLKIQEKLQIQERMDLK